jgi:hypothetical protein
MLARWLIGSLLLIQITCKSKPAGEPDRLIVDSHLIMDSTPPVVEFIFQMPIYWDMDGSLVEHGTLPVTMKGAVFNNIQLQSRIAGADTTARIYFTAFPDTSITDKLFTITAEDLNGQSYSGEIKINEKSYLDVRK